MVLEINIYVSNEFTTCIEKSTNNNIKKHPQEIYLKKKKKQNKKQTNKNKTKTKQKTNKQKQNEYIKGIKQEKRQPVLNHE